MLAYVTVIIYKLPLYNLCIKLLQGISELVKVAKYQDFATCWERDMSVQKSVTFSTLDGQF